MAVPIETDDGAFRGDPDAGEGDVTEDTTEDEHSEEGEEEPVEKGGIYSKAYLRFILSVLKSISRF